MAGGAGVGLCRGVLFPHFLLRLSDPQLQACPLLVPESLAFSTRESGWGTATHRDPRLRSHRPVPSGGQRAEAPPCKWQLVQGVANAEAEARAREVSPGVWDGENGAEGTLACLP